MKLSVADVAARTGMSESWVRDHAEGLGGVKDGRSWTFTPADVDVRANHLRQIAERDAAPEEPTPEEAPEVTA